MFEGGGANEDNNSLYLAPPLVIDPPPPSQLVVSSITLPEPGDGEIGRPVHRELDRHGRRARPTPRREAGRMRSTSAPGPPGALPTSTWGRSCTRGRSQPGGSYTGTLATVMPSLAPGQYHIIVRTDIFNQLSLPAGVPELEQDDGVGRSAHGGRRQPDAGRALCDDALERPGAAAAGDRAAGSDAASDA